MIVQDQSIVDLQTASVLLCKSINTLKAWIRQGCPVVERGGPGKPWKIRIGDVLSWREEKAALSAIGNTSQIDTEEGKRRKVVAEAALCELELAKKKGEVVLIDEVAAIVGEDYARCRAKLLAIPSKLAPILDPSQDTEERRDLIEQSIIEALYELVGYGIGELAAAEEAATGDPAETAGKS